MACIGFKLPSFENVERVVKYKPREERRQELPIMPYDKIVMPYPYPFGNQFLHGLNFGFMPWCPWILNTTIIHMCMLDEKRRPHQNTYLSDRRSGCCLCFFSRLGEAPRGALDGDSTDCRVTARERLIPALSPASSPLNARPLPNFLPQPIVSQIF